MRKILTLSLALIMLFACLVSCSKEEPEAIYEYRTLAFFQSMENGTFWFDAKIVTAAGAEYKLAQATNGVDITTIKDNSYEIFHNGSDSKYVHKLKVSLKTYDTVITKNGTGFIFESYNSNMFVKPAYKGEEELNGKTYYYEAFKTNASTNSDTKVYDKYYFEGNTLVAVVTPSMTVYINEYSTEIPSYIYLSAPSDFKAGTLTEETEIDFEDVVK